MRWVWQEGSGWGTHVDAVLPIADARVGCGTEVDHVTVFLDLVVTNRGFRHAVLQKQLFRGLWMRSPRHKSEHGVPLPGASPP